MYGVGGRVAMSLRDAETMNSMESDFSMIEFASRHVTRAVELSTALGWSYRQEDWAFAVALGKGAVIENAGRLVATAMWWPFGESHATFGMIIVSPSLQGRGVGRRLVLELLRQAGDRTVLLNSTREGRRLYEQLGFVPYGRIHQHQGMLSDDLTPAGPAMGIRAAQRVDFEPIANLDEHVTGMRRRELLKALFDLGSVAVVDRLDFVQGYACSRRFGRGYVIGPVIATDATDAKALIAELASRLAGEFVRVDVPADSELSSWLEIAGLKQVDQVVSMHRGPRPTDHGDGRLFALASQSLG